MFASIQNFEQEKQPWGFIPLFNRRIGIMLWLRLAVGLSFLWKMSSYSRYMLTVDHPMAPYHGNIDQHDWCFISISIMKIHPLQYLHDISTFQYVPFILLVVSCCIPWNSTRYVIIYPHNIFVFSVSGVGILVMDFHTQRLSSAYVFGVSSESLCAVMVGMNCFGVLCIHHKKCPQQEGLDWWSREIESDDVHCVVLLLQVNIKRLSIPTPRASLRKKAQFFQSFPFRQLTEANAEEFQPTERLGRFLSPLLCHLCLCFQQGTRALWSPIKRV